MSETDFVIVVDWLPLRDALPAHRRWLGEHGYAESDVDSTQVSVETGRGPKGDLRRVRLSSNELVRLGIDLRDSVEGT